MRYCFLSVSLIVLLSVLIAPVSAIEPSHQAKPSQQASPFSVNGFIPPHKPQQTIHDIRGFHNPPKPIRPSIVIDAGHGGKDPGAISISGYKEKHIALRAAKLLASELKKTGRYHVSLTRSRDVFLPIRKRYACARKAHADFFISIHADSHPSKSVRGLTIYTLSRKASDREAARLARRENKAAYFDHLPLADDLDEGIYDVLVDIAQGGSSRTAQKLAKKLHASCARHKVGKLMQLRSAALTVLKAPEVPSLLIELGYLSNKHDERLVQSKAYLNKLAKSLIHALDSYYTKT